jgi:biotin carboxyl carrier protein
MKGNRKWLRWTVLALVLLLAAGTVFAAGLVDHKAVLSGRVSGQDLTNAGQDVREGDVLVRVETVAGAQPAVRAAVNGVVREVLVRPGDTIQAGKVVVRVERR